MNKNISIKFNQKQKKIVMRMIEIWKLSLADGVTMDQDA